MPTGRFMVEGSAGSLASSPQKARPPAPKRFAKRVQKKSEEMRQWSRGSSRIDLVVFGCQVSDPVTAVADSLQALRNGTTDEQWDGLKANPLVRDLISRCADLEAAWLISDQPAVDGVCTRRGKVQRSSVDARLLLAA